MNGFEIKMLGAIAGLLFVINRIYSYGIKPFLVKQKTELKKQRGNHIRLTLIEHGLVDKVQLREDLLSWDE